MEEIGLALFVDYVGSTFQIEWSPQEISPVELIEAAPLNSTARHDKRGRPAGFSLLFRDQRGGHRPQGTYPVSHEAVGTVAIFLVPIGPDELGERYEAIFN